MTIKSDGTGMSQLVGEALLAHDKMLCDEARTLEVKPRDKNWTKLFRLVLEYLIGLDTAHMSHAERRRMLEEVLRP